MKVFALATIGVVLAADPAKVTGTACTVTSDCGDDMCCGVATGGKMCATAKCEDTTTSKFVVPNVMICNFADKTK